MTNETSTRAELVAMTDEQILAHYRETNPYISLRTAKELHRDELKFWHLGAIKRKAEREARDAERRRLPDLVSRHVSSAADQAGPRASGTNSTPVAGRKSTSSRVVETE